MRCKWHAAHHQHKQFSETVLWAWGSFIRVRASVPLKGDSLCHSVIFYLFIFSIHQGHSKCLLFSSDLIIYNLGPSLKVHFPLASPSRFSFLPCCIKFSEQEPDLPTSLKFEKAKNKCEYLVKRTTGLIPIWHCLCTCITWYGDWYFYVLKFIILWEEP